MDLGSIGELHLHAKNHHNLSGTTISGSVLVACTFPEGISIAIDAILVAVPPYAIGVLDQHIVQFDSYVVVQEPRHDRVFHDRPCIQVEVRLDGKDRIIDVHDGNIAVVHGLRDLAGILENCKASKTCQYGSGRERVSAVADHRGEKQKICHFSHG